MAEPRHAIDADHPGVDRARQRKQFVQDRVDEVADPDRAHEDHAIQTPTLVTIEPRAALQLFEPDFVQSDLHQEFPCTSGDIDSQPPRLERSTPGNAREFTFWP